MGWPIATLVVVAAVAVACLARLWWHALFVGLWAVLAFAALVVVYYSSTSPISWHLATSADRVVFSIVLGLATVAPLLVMPAWDPDDPTCQRDAAAAVDLCSGHSLRCPLGSFVAPLLGREASEHPPAGGGSPGAPPCPAARVDGAAGAGHEPADLRW